MSFTIDQQKFWLHSSVAIASVLGISLGSVNSVLAEFSLRGVGAGIAAKEAFTPPGEGAPTQTVGGASRGSCATGSLTDVRFTGQNGQSILTAQLPENMAAQVFFSVKNEINKTIYQGFIPVTQPENRVEIKSNLIGTLNAKETYTWSMAIICGTALRPDSPVFQGNL